MSKEWNDVGWEHRDVPELQAPGDEYAGLVKEMSEPAKEYASVPEEFAESNVEPKDTKDSNQLDVRKKAKRKLRRKMAYMVASGVAVLSMAQTLNTSLNPEVKEEQEQSQSSDFEWPKVPGLDGTYGGTAQVEKNESLLLYIDAYDSYGWGYGNTIPVKSGELWGLLDYAGNVIVEPSYTGYWTAANEDGYDILNDENGYYVIGQDKKVHSYSGSISDIRIGDGNIVSYHYTVPYGEYGVASTIVYEKLDGTQIYRTENMADFDWYDSYVPFHEGRAYVYQSAENGETILTELKLDGTWNVIASSEEPYGTMAPQQGYSEEYFFGTYPGGGGGFYLYNVETAEASERMIGVNTGLFPEVDWETWYDENQNATFAGVFETPDFSDYMYAENVTWKSYYSDGYYLAHYGTYGCLEVVMPDGVKDVLFNYFDVEDEVLDNAVAIYDKILFDDFKYLAVLDGDAWKYIDYTGKVVSKDYSDATSFNDDGYAMVIEKEGMSYVIDRNFNKVKEIEGVESVANSGELFSLECKFDGAVDMKEGTYLYYHQ